MNRASGGTARSFDVVACDVAHPDANIIFGTVVDETLEEDIQVTVIAAGFDRFDEINLDRRDTNGAEPQSNSSHAFDTVDQSARSNFIGHPKGFINEFAALPSFHVGWVALASAVLFIATDRRRIKVVLIIPTVLMSTAVVLTANHYVVDIFAGVGLSMLSLFLATKLTSRQSAGTQEIPRKL